jgi:hypothetical protein
MRQEQACPDMLSLLMNAGSQLLPNDCESLEQKLQRVLSEPVLRPSKELAIWRSDHPPAFEAVGWVPKNLERLTLLDFATAGERGYVQFVKQLTRLSSEVYRLWYPADHVTNWFITGSTCQSAHAEISKMFYGLVEWVKRSLNTCESDNERVKLAEFWIMIAFASCFLISSSAQLTKQLQNLRPCRNYMAAFAIMAGLQDLDIQAPKKTKGMKALTSKLRPPRQVSETAFERYKSECEWWSSPGGELYFKAYDKARNSYSFTIPCLRELRSPIFSKQLR